MTVTIFMVMTMMMMMMMMMMTMMINQYVSMVAVQPQSVEHGLRGRRCRFNHHGI